MFWEVNTPPPPPPPQTPEGVETENQTETTQPSDESAETLAQVQPGSEAQQGETSADEDEEIEIVVTGEQEGGYIAPSATTGTRTDTPLRDLPQSIQVVPQQVLEDQQVIRLNEALRNVSGVRDDDSFAGTIDRINIRGFTQDVFLRDSFRQSQFSLRETANLEQIEVLKGPASVLYGNLEPGGVVNLVTKKPLSEPYYSAELLGGSYGFYRPNIDLSGLLNTDRTLLYRLNAVYESNDGFRDFDEVIAGSALERQRRSTDDQNVERVFVAPVLTWQVGENTDLTLEFDYLNDERPFDDGLVATGTGVADVPRDRIFQNPDAVRKVEEFGAGYQLEHRFSENWTLRNAFRFLSSDSFDFRLTSWIIEDTGQLDRRWRSNDDLYESYALQTNLVGEFTTGAINHTLLFGVDLNRETRVGGQRRLPGDPSFFLNIFTQEADLIFKPDLSDLTLFARNENNSLDTLGIYLQDQIAVSDNLKLLLGGRFDSFDQRSIDLASNTTFNQERQRFSPRIGLVYQPSEQISLHASYSQSFNPDIFSISADGTPLEPTTGTQYEVGIKGEFLDGRLSTTLAAYEITKENVATTDPDNTDFSIAVGEVRSRGVELDVVGEIADGWNIIASYAYTDAEITEDNFFSVENRLTNVPENSASLWTTYEIQKGSLQGLGFGAGLFFVGDRQRETALFSRVLDLHYTLLLGNTGLIIVGIAAFLLVILSVTGIVLWPGWPQLISGFKIKRLARPKRVNFDIHKVAGIITAGFLAAIAITGFCWNFYDYAEPAIYAATFTPKPPDVTSTLVNGKPTLKLNEILRRADVALPGATNTFINLPKKPDEVFDIYKKVPGDSEDFSSYVKLDQFSGRVLYVQDSRIGGLGDRILNSFTPIHYGTFGGLPTRIFYVFVGLAPLVLFITGFVMWRYRYQAKSGSQMNAREPAEQRR